MYFVEQGVKKTALALPTYNYIYGNEGRIKFPTVAYSDTGGWIFTVQSLYDFCCGMREISVSYLEKAETIYNAVEEWRTSRQGEVCFCLNYTEVVYCDEEPAHSNIRKWLEMYPTAEHTSPWYNGNSGNYVMMWSIPINQEIKQEDDDD